ncbi:MAG TPA: DNA-directed DNA polymerase I [candidate division Zixibacteria bacterium]|nr:DNA-directed DNA polymerase I [candidate division Zixibacteria bacterium]
MSKEQKSLDAFFSANAEKKEDKKKDVAVGKSKDEINAKKRIDLHTNDIDLSDDDDLVNEFEKEDDEEEKIFEGAPVELCPTNTPSCCLLQSIYDGKSGKGFLYLLDETSNRLYGYYDNTGHKPYCLSDLSVEDLQKISPVKNFKKIVGYETVKLKNLLLDKKVDMTKILVTDPLAIGGGYDSLRDKLPAAWEANIRYHKNYLYDCKLVPGMYYQIKNGNLSPVIPVIDKKVESQIKELFKNSPKEVLDLIPQYLPLLLSRIPHIKRAAIDIEVYTQNMDRIADPNKALEKIISIAIVGNDGTKITLVLKRDDVSIGTRSKEISDDIEVIFFDDEKELLKRFFEIIKDFPMIVTFNGDNFDLPYLFNRANLLKIDSTDNPIIITRDHALIRNAIHFDAYRFFNQAAIKVYAFGGKYKESSLDAISTALLGTHKVVLEKEIGNLSCYRLAWYNYWDSKITLDLTTFNDSVTVRLIILLMRLTGMPFEDITRQAVSTWIRNWLFAEHRYRKYLIPRPEEIISSRGDSTTDAMIKGKKYKGAIVVTPNPGVHFDVTVLDFASLYPSIIKTWNLSYETMNCGHESCQAHKKMIPDTEHWVCTKNSGLMAILIGFIRDIRVLWFKPKTKDKTLDQNTRNFYEVIQSALKVVINASYGVFGASHFPFYCPPLAEATTAIGRQAITKTIEKCNEMNIPVIYGDTDSVFLKSPTKEQVQALIKWSDAVLKIDLDYEKTYRYLALSDRKKNYLGVFPNGEVDVKGLLGKKRNTPPFLKNVFNEIVQILSEIHKEEDFEQAKEEIEAKVRQCYTDLKNRKLPIEDLVFKVQLNKGLNQYVKTTPQHVKAARLLEKTGKMLGAGDLISFVKTSDSEGVKPIELANVSEIDIDKYLAQMDSTLRQVLEPIGVSFDKIIGIRSLDDFF